MPQKISQFLYLQALLKDVQDALPLWMSSAAGRPQALWALQNLAMWENWSVFGCGTLHLFVVFLRRGKMCILRKLRLGIISMESLLWQPWDFPALPDREYLRGSRELTSYAPGILFYLPATSKHSKIILQQMGKCTWRIKWPNMWLIWMSTSSCKLLCKAY